MCIKHSESLIGIPVKLIGRPDGSKVVEFTTLVAKATSKRHGGDHSTEIAYPLQRWSFDPNYQPYSHDRSIHLAPSGAVKDGEFNSYGSHRVIMFPSRTLWGSGDSSGRCWHDQAVFPVTCVDCEGIDLDVLSQEDFWKDLGLVPPGHTEFPNGDDFLKPPLADHLFTRRILLQPKTVFDPRVLKN